MKRFQPLLLAFLSFTLAQPSYGGDADQCRLTAVLLLDQPEIKTGAFWVNARNDTTGSQGFQTGVGNWDPRARVTGHATLPFSDKGWTFSTGQHQESINRDEQRRFARHIWIADRPRFHQDGGKTSERLVHIALETDDVTPGARIAAHWSVRQSKELAALKEPTLTATLQQGNIDAPWINLTVMAGKDGDASVEIPKELESGLVWLRIGIAEGTGKADRLWADIPLTIADSPRPIPSPTKQDSISIGKKAAKSAVPSSRTQGVFLHPQSITSIEIASDEKQIGVTTMAFRHDRNFWMIDANGEVRSSRFVEPWAPFQSAVLPGGKTSVVGLAYSRFTDPSPTIAIDHEGKETALVDAFWDMGWIRYGEGDWRTGWNASLIGDLLVPGRDRAFTVASHNGAVEIGADGSQNRYPLNYQRPYRMASSGDGHVVAFGYLAPDNDSLKEEMRKRLRLPPAMLQVRDARTSAVMWQAKPLADVPRPLKPPQPAEEFGEFADDFNMKPLATVPFRGALSVALNEDGSRCAVAEYGGWLRIKRERGIGKWNPDHQLFLLPRQRGRVRIFGPRGQDLAHFEIPKPGLFDVVWSRDHNDLWCVPSSWFSRGLAGKSWLPTEFDGDTVFRWNLSKQVLTGLTVPDAVSDFALHPQNGKMLIACWDGNIYLCANNGKLEQTIAVGAPARVKWSPTGRFAVYGTQNGDVGSIDADGKQRWRFALPVKEVPVLKEPIKPIYEDAPIYAVGRVGTEHAYVGDIWLIKTKEGGILVDTGGTSGQPLTWQRLKSVGIDPKDIKFVLLSHSHGDHAGAAYLWRTLGAKIVAPKTAEFTVSWAMPTWSDYSIWVPSAIDMPLPLKAAGDTADIKLCGLPIKAVFVPGHAFDSVIYVIDFDGKRVAFTGDIGFDGESHILHRCWGDREKAAKVVTVMRDKVLPLKPIHVFTGHGARAKGTEFIEDLLKRTTEALAK